MTAAVHDEKRLQINIVRVSIVLSIVILVLTLGAGMIANSITMLLDAAAGSVMVIMAFVLNGSIKKVHLPPDRLFNFGYEKYEPFTVVIQGSMIMFSCLIASYFAIQDIVHADDITRYDIPMVVAVIAGMISAVPAVYFRVISKRTGSHMMKAASLHWAIDSVLSFGMFLGFSFGFYMHRLGYYRVTPYVDPVMALVLAVLLIWTPLRLMKAGIRQLLDGVPSKEVCGEIEKIAEIHKAKSFGIHSIRMRNCAEKVFIDICFLIHGHATMTQAQQFAEDFKKDVAARFPKHDIIVYFRPTI